MKRVVSIILVFAVTLTLFAVVPAQARTGISFYVAYDGCDSNDGSIGSPFATAEGARDAIRNLRVANGGELPRGVITVNFRGGQYERRNTFVLEQQDSGTARSPIIYRAFPGETVYWDGGLVINAADFTPVTDAATLNRAHPNAREHLLQFDLNTLFTPQEIDDFARIRTTGSTVGGDLEINGVRVQPPSQMELSIDNTTMQVARWPNCDTELVRVGNVIERGGTRFDQPLNRSLGGTFEIDTNRPSQWRDLDDVWIWGWVSWHFYDDIFRVRNFDLANQRITLDTIAYYGIIPWCSYGHNSFYFFNIFEEIDVPGEYFIDRSTGILYLFPPEGFSASSKVQLSILEEDMVRGTSVSFITFSCITFENSRSNAFVFLGGENNTSANNSNNITVTNSTIRNLGGFAMWANEHAQAIGISHSRLYDLGHGGFRTELSNGRRIGSSQALRHSPKARLFPNNYFFVGNEAFRTARIWSGYRPPVTLQGVDNVASFNILHENPQMSILFNGVGNVMEFNHIFNSCRVMSDIGVIYSYGRGVNFDNHLRHNFFHDNGDSRYALKEVYLDGGKGTFVHGNVFARFQSDANVVLSNNNTQHNHIFNNIFIDNRVAGSVTHNLSPNWPIDSSNHTDHLGGIRLSQPEVWERWHDRYPRYALHGNRDEWDDASNNYLFDNLFVNNNGQIIQHIGLYTTFFNRQRENLIMSGDPGFVDMLNDDFRLRPDSPVFEVMPNFEPILWDYIANFEKYYARRMSGTVSIYIENSSALIGAEVVAIDSDNYRARPVVVSVGNNNVTLVPVRFIAEALGANLRIDGGLISITLGDTEVRMTVGSNSMTVNNQPLPIATAPRTIEGVMLIPVCAIAEALGMYLFRDARGLIVISEQENLFELRPAQGSADFFLVLETIRRIITN